MIYLLALFSFQLVYNLFQFYVFFPFKIIKFDTKVNGLHIHLITIKLFHYLHSLIYIRFLINYNQIYCFYISLFILHLHIQKPFTKKFIVYIIIHHFKYLELLWILHYPIYFLWMDQGIHNEHQSVHH